MMNKYVVEDHLEAIAEGTAYLFRYVTDQNKTPLALDFSKLRPSGTPTTNQHGTATGPVSFMSVYDSALTPLNHSLPKIYFCLSQYHQDVAIFLKEAENFKNVQLVLTDTLHPPTEKTSIISVAAPFDSWEEPDAAAQITPEVVVQNKTFKGIPATYIEIPTAQGPLHIHLVGQKGDALKVFANLPPIGTELSNCVSVIAILLSKYFQNGGKVENILKHLRSVKSDRAIQYQGVDISSIPAAFALALQQYQKKEKACA